MPAPAWYDSLVQDSPYQKRQKATAQPTAKPGFGDYVDTAVNLYRMYDGAGDLNQARQMAEDGARQRGLEEPRAPAPPASSSKTRRAGREIGALAANFIPVAGPYISTGLKVVGGDIDQRNADKYMRQLAGMDQEGGLGLQNPYVGESGTERRERIAGAPSSVAGGAATGASIGTAVTPGWGTLIGGVIGAAAGGIGGHRKKKQQKAREKESEKIAQDNETKLADYEARRQWLKKRLRGRPASMIPLAIDPRAI